ncbi:MAG: hypothetical protein JXA21_16500 [Anaerolineae bacterium]|nr:hypothetical protein [Anaerolineae bacterium]
MKIQDENYEVTYDQENTTVIFQGTLRLRGVTEYEPVAQLLSDVAAQSPETITLDLRSLHFLNSSGINILFRFVINMREQATTAVVVRGTSEIPWQTKSLKNLQRLMPSLQLEFD